MGATVWVFDPAGLTGPQVVASLLRSRVTAVADLRAGADGRLCTVLSRWGIRCVRLGDVDDVELVRRLQVGAGRFTVAVASPDPADVLAARLHTADPAGAWTLRPLPPAPSR